MIWLLLAPVVLLAALFVYCLLDPHTHCCGACDVTWRHCGLFASGSVQAHSCPSCGEPRWLTW